MTVIDSQHDLVGAVVSVDVIRGRYRASPLGPVAEVPGERQRIAIARALAVNPPILIFDEATSALDSRTEKSIQAELAEISRDRTTLVIAHRLSTIVDADEMLVLDHGSIVERGTFRQLLGANGRFAEMWRLQQEEKAELEEVA